MWNAFSAEAAGTVRNGGRKWQSNNEGRKTNHFGHGHGVCAVGLGFGVWKGDARSGRAAGRYELGLWLRLGLGLGGWPLPRSGVPKSKKSRIQLIDVIDNTALDAQYSSEWFAVTFN